MEPLPGPRWLEIEAAFRAFPLRQARGEPGDNLQASRDAMRAFARILRAFCLAVQPDGRCRLFRCSNALQLISRPPAIRALFAEDALRYGALVDDKRVRCIVDRLHGLPDAESPVVFLAHLICSCDKKDFS